VQLKIKNKSNAYCDSDATERGAFYSALVQIPSSGMGVRISDLSKRIGTREKASKMIGVSAPQLQRYIREESSAPFDVMARLCAIAGVSMEWLATGQEQVPIRPEQSQDLSAETLKVAVRMVEGMLQATNRRLTPDQMAEAVLLTLELLRSGLPEADVLSLAKRAIGLAQMSA